MMVISADKLSQFRQEGYLVLEGVISEADLAGLRHECQTSLEAQMASMEMVGAETLGLTHKHQRYSLPCRHEESEFLTGFLFGDLMFDIVRTAVGNEAYLFLELFVVKWPRTGLPFGWHQDSGYLLGHPNKPYFTLWCALDDMTEDNGALYVLPTNRTDSRTVVAHVRDKKSNDLVGYFGADPGIALEVSAGSIVVLSSHTFHRSGANVTDHTRRAFLASYSPEPIRNRSGQLWNQAVPFIKNGALSDNCNRLGVRAE